MEGPPPRERWVPWRPQNVPSWLETICWRTRKCTGCKHFYHVKWCRFALGSLLRAQLFTLFLAFCEAIGTGRGPPRVRYLTRRVRGWKADDSKLVVEADALSFRARFHLSLLPPRPPPGSPTAELVRGIRERRELESPD